MLRFPISTPWPATAQPSPIYHFPALRAWAVGKHSRYVAPEDIIVGGKALLPSTNRPPASSSEWSGNTKQNPPKVTAQPAASPAALPSPHTHPPDHFPTACTRNSNFPVAFIFYWWAIKSPARSINASIIVFIYLSPSPGKESRGGKQKSKWIKEASETRVSTHLRSQIKVNS